MWLHTHEHVHIYTISIHTSCVYMHVQVHRERDLNHTVMICTSDKFGDTKLYVLNKV